MQNHPADNSTAIAPATRNDSNLATYDAPLRPADVARQVALVQDVMRNVMRNVMWNVIREGEHYGRIPGCGKKPALLKSGGEKLAMTFRLAPDYDIQIIDLGNGHREYRVCCRLVHIPTGEMRGQGWGSCSTMESKYRYRHSDTVIVSHEVPGRYWQLKKQAKHREAAEFLPAGCRVMKQHDGTWAIVKSEKIENPDIADTYNTVLKIANKRALLAALLTATAASDIFAMSDFGTEDDDEDDAPICPPATTAGTPGMIGRHNQHPAQSPPQHPQRPTRATATPAPGHPASSPRPEPIDSRHGCATSMPVSTTCLRSSRTAMTLPAIKDAIDAIAADAANTENMGTRAEKPSPTDVITEADMPF